MAELLKQLWNERICFFFFAVITVCSNLWSWPLRVFCDQMLPGDYRVYWKHTRNSFFQKTNKTMMMTYHRWNICKWDVFFLWNSSQQHEILTLILCLSLVVLQITTLVYLLRNKHKKDSLSSRVDSFNCKLNSVFFIILHNVSSTFSAISSTHSLNRVVTKRKSLNHLFRWLM